MPCENEPTQPRPALRRGGRARWCRRARGRRGRRFVDRDRITEITAGYIRRTIHGAAAGALPEPSGIVVFEPEAGYGEGLSFREWVHRTFGHGGRRAEDEAESRRSLVVANLDAKSSPDARPRRRQRVSARPGQPVRRSSAIRSQAAGFLQRPPTSQCRSEPISPITEHNEVMRGLWETEKASRTLRRRAPGPCDPPAGGLRGSVLRADTQRRRHHRRVPSPGSRHSGYLGTST